MSPARRATRVAAPPPGELDLHLFNEGTHRQIHDFLGAHVDDVGTNFAVWAPNARSVCVIGDWNEWRRDVDRLEPIASSGVWFARAEGARLGHRYKYLVAPAAGAPTERADPVAFRSELPPGNASIIERLDYTWHDRKWMRGQHAVNRLDQPISIYEVHLGSVLPRHEDGSFADYVTIGQRIADHVEAAGFTHVEFLPVMEHPFYGSWGYQTTSYFAPTGRYGGPAELMAMIDLLHQRGIGVILDWVPSHFPADAHALARFDGTALYEHADPRLGHHPDWDSAIFNYGRNEVRSFLQSSAHFWLDRYHADGLRVDAVASMLYRDYSRREGEWIPNRYGGRENLEAIEFLRQLNVGVYAAFPDVQTYAEESTAWPGVTRPVHAGGLGFGFKWDMGWMHDTLQHLSRDPVHRPWHHHELTFRAVYRSSENFVLPLSHDEVVHGKGSLLSRMVGDDEQRFAGLRLLLAYQWAQPGKKLLFAGGELAPWQEWSHEHALPVEALAHPAHAGVFHLVQDLNRCYRTLPALHQWDCEDAGFEWVDAEDAASGIIAFLRQGSDRQPVLVVANFTPVARTNRRVGVPVPGRWREILNTDASHYGGRGVGNFGGLDTSPAPMHGRMQSLMLTVPPLGLLLLQPE